MFTVLSPIDYTKKSKGEEFSIHEAPKGSSIGTPGRVLTRALRRFFVARFAWFLCAGFYFSSMKDWAPNTPRFYSFFRVFLIHNFARVLD